VWRRHVRVDDDDDARGARRTPMFRWDDDLVPSKSGLDAYSTSLNPTTVESLGDSLVVTLFPTTLFQIFAGY
jgi:hypothetical protein